ncbi:MAG: dTDP-4-dehydrorhamnose 3,5-epimerase [Betaproteobacteria bacterium]|nr:MAG: dTDP-4-dehydrorhamnose 3,5-epimerase [Betaproteobacteria bacterium]
MNVIPTALAGCFVLEPKVFGDARGSFMESWNAKLFAEKIAANVSFVQDNQSVSQRGVLRGLHYQIEQPQGKLVRVIDGEVYDVAVDLRRSSPTFRQWVGVTLSAENHRQFWIPPGFAHGFLVTSERATFLYKTTDYYAPAHDRTLAWNDPSLAIPWPLADIGEPTVSEKDLRGKPLSEADTYA